MAAQILGILATIFGAIGIIFLGFLLGPLSVILGLIAVILAFAMTSTSQAKIWSIVGLVVGVVACITSPILMGTIIGLSSTTINRSEADKPAPQTSTLSPEAEQFMQDMQN